MSRSQYTLSARALLCASQLSANWQKTGSRVLFELQLWKGRSNEGSDNTYARGTQQYGEEGIYIVGDHAFQENFLPLNYLDAITNYDVHNSLKAKTDGYAYQAGIDQYTESQGHWHNLAHEENVQYIPAVISGFNNLALANPSSLLLRQMAPDWPLGSLFEETLRQAQNMVDLPANNLLFVVSWNKWHKDTVRMCMTIDLMSSCYGRSHADSFCLSLYWFCTCSKLNLELSSAEPFGLTRPGLQRLCWLWLIVFWLAAKDDCGRWAVMGQFFSSYYGNWA